MSVFQGLYDIRDGKPEDTNFILATFLRGVYYGNPWYNKMPKDIFMANYKALAEALIVRGVVKVACLKEDADVILGYSLLSADYTAINWVYVKNSKMADGTTWRKKGIGRSLVPKHPVSVSHLTEIGESLLSKFESNPIFNPFKL